MTLWRDCSLADDIVRERNYKVLRQRAEDVVEFSYRPGTCKRDYRVIALRKNISVERGENVLLCEYRYFFDITNDQNIRAMASRGRQSPGASDSNNPSTRSAQSAAHTATIRRSASWTPTPVVQDCERVVDELGGTKSRSGFRG